MAQHIEITDPMRRALEEYGAESKVFQQWSKIHRDFKGVFEGQRMTTQFTTRGTVLTHWYGPKVLQALLGEQDAH